MIIAFINDLNSIKLGQAVLILGPIIMPSFICKLMSLVITAVTNCTPALNSITIIIALNTSREIF